MLRKLNIVFSICLAFSAATTGCSGNEEKRIHSAQTKEQLPSWKGSGSKKGIIDFVNKTSI